MVIVAKAEKLALLAGAVRLTVGGPLDTSGAVSLVALQTVAFTV
jgi:hypothetical protein